jgi:hypothetical protein
MAFYLTLFCESGLDSADVAVGMLVSEAEEHDEGLAIRNRKDGPGWVSGEVMSARSGGEAILLELRTDQAMVQTMVRDYGRAAGAPHLAGTDLLITLTLGEDPDWPLVRDLWISAAKLWHMVPHSDVTGFDIGLDSLP